jgi:hypothetical protein
LGRCICPIDDGKADYRYERLSCQVILLWTHTACEHHHARLCPRCYRCPT